MKKLVIVIALILIFSSVTILAQTESSTPSSGGGGGVSIPAVPAPSEGSGGGGCSDSDGGFNYYDKGKVTYYPSNKTYTDYCKDDKTLIEYSCGKIECSTTEICTEKNITYVSPNQTTEGNATGGSAGGGGVSCSGKTECRTVDSIQAYACPNNCEDGACVGEKVKELVTCTFINSKTEQKCYSADSTRSCNGIESCVVDIEGYSGEKIVWKSSCGGYAYTITDGENDYAKFDCSEAPPEPKPVCGNSICEQGEGEVCYVITSDICKVGEPCEAEEQCKVVCPADCGVVPEKGVRSNQKFKLQLKESASVIDYKNMEIQFLDLYQAKCAVREIYEGVKAIVTATGSVVDSSAETSTQVEEVYSTKVAEVNVSEEGGRVIDVDSGQITKCIDGGIIARLAVTIEEEPTKYVSIQLGERKPVFGVTLSFLDYYSKYNTGVFLVSKEQIPCPEGCICSADGSIACPPTPICPKGTILCPDGECREQCKIIITDECKFACMYGESCLPIGTRVEGKFCSIDRNLENQLPSSESCENNFECKSNVCVDSECVSGSLLRKILSWFKRLFSKD